MNYTVTIVYIPADDDRYIIGANRAAVEHMLAWQLANTATCVLGNGDLCMPEPPVTLAELAEWYDISDARLAEALDIDAAMRSIEVQHVG